MLSKPQINSKIRFNAHNMQGGSIIHSPHTWTQGVLCGPGSPDGSITNPRTRRAVDKHDNYTKIMGHLNSQVVFWTLAFASLSSAELAPRTIGQNRNGSPQTPRLLLQSYFRQRIEVNTRERLGKLLQVANLSKFVHTRWSQSFVRSTFNCSAQVLRSYSGYRGCLDSLLHPVLTRFWPSPASSKWCRSS